MALKVTLATGAAIVLAVIGQAWVIAVLCAIYAAVAVNNWRVVGSK